MSLHHHAAELFLKYALARAGESVPPHHHLRALRDLYKTAYPDPEFDFQPPFVTVFMGHSQSEAEQAKQDESEYRNRNKMDQATRYHTDREGQPWPGAHAVVPDSYPDEIAGLRNRIRLLHEVIEKRRDRR